jgi:hypothetical protein
MKNGNNRKKVERNVANALADVPIDNKQERDTLRTRMRKKYGEMDRLKAGMRTDVRRRFNELGELMEQLEACESRPPETRS